MRLSGVRRLTLCVLGVLVAAGAASAEPLTAVLDPYFRIQSQLADDRMDGVTKDAAVIAEAAGTLGGDARPVSSAARELSAATSLEGARKAFAALSSALIAYADATKAALGQDVRAVHCPMANATWLQKGDTIRNPHFGKSMLTCGEIRKRPGK